MIPLRSLRPAHFAGATLLLLGLACAVGPMLLPIRDPDFFWHLRNGEWIVQHGSLPQELLGAAVTQEMSPETRHFIATSYWLSQVGLHLVHANAGAAGIVALRFVLFGSLLLVLARSLAGDALVRLGLLVLAACALGVYPPERPQYLSFISAALLLRLLEGFRAATSAARLRRSALGIPLLLLVWANCHGGYIVGLALIGITILGEAARRLSPRLEPLPATRWRLLLAAGAGALALSFANPNGGFVFGYAWIPAWLRGYVTEYQSTVGIFGAFGRASILAFWLLLALTAASFALSRKKPDPGAILLCAATGWLAFTQWRFVAFFVIAALPAASRQLSGNRTLRAARAAVCAAAFVACGYLLAKEGRDLLGFRRAGEVDRNLFPVAAAEFIEREGLRGNIFGRFYWGGYLLWRLAPARVYIDGRIVDRQLLESYFALLEGRAGDVGRSRASLLADAGIVLTVTEFFDARTGAFYGLVDDLMADPAWDPVHISRNAVVFAQRTAENREIIERDAIPKGMFGEFLVAHLDRLLAANPEAAALHVARGDVLERLGDREGALGSWREALRLAPESRAARERIPIAGASGGG